MVNQFNFLLIIGVHRSGTSALFDILRMSPQITPSIKKELHYFTPLRFENTIKKTFNYRSKFQQPNQYTKYLLEASPSYFYGRDKIASEIINQLGRDAKCILILRNPINRFVSFYNHLKYTNIIEQELTLFEFIEKSKLQLGKPIEDEVYSRGLREGNYVDYIKSWQELFGENLNLLFYENLFSDADVHLNSICNWLDIKLIQSDVKLQRVNKSRVYKNRYLHNLAMHLNNKYSKELINNPMLKKNARVIYNLLNTEEILNDYSKRESDVLADFYAKKNHELKIYLKNNLSHLKLPAWIKNA